MRQFMNLFESENLLMDDASRMQRAKELGFTTLAYHGTGASFTAFDLDKGKTNVLSGHAPHFTDSKAEAKGYAKIRKEKGQKTNVLECLLKIKKPFYCSFYHKINKKEFKKIVGRFPSDELKHHTNEEYTTHDALRELSNIYGWERDKYKDRKMMWTLIYKRLKSLGYDSIIFPDTPADHSIKNYNKIVILDPKNVRSIKAKFDPAESESSNLMA